MSGDEGLDFVGTVRIETSDLAKLVAQAEKATKQTGRNFDELSQKMTNAGQKMTLLTTVPIAAGLAYATKAASDLNESMNVTDITFKEAKGEVEAFVKEAYKIGQSERAAREATASFGGLLQNLGYIRKESADVSISLTKLASDMGSAFNKEPAEAAQALSAALRGETEPIRAFNVSVSDAEVRQKAVALGLAASTAEVDKHGKAQATLALIMEQTKNVQGDFANTADGVANSTRVTKAEIENTAAAIGTQLLPIAKQAIDGIQGLVGVFAGLNETQQIALLGTLAFVAALGPILTVGGNVVKTVGLIQSAYEKVGSTATLSAGVVGIALAAMGAQLVDQLSDAENFKASLENLNSTDLGGLTEDFNKLSERFRENGGAAVSLKGAWNFLENQKLNETAQELGERFEKLSDIYERVAKVTHLNSEEVQKLAATQKLDLSKSTQELANELSLAYVEMETGTVTTNKLGDATEVLASSVATAEDRLKAYKDALDAALGVTLTTQEAELRLAELTDKLGEKYKEAAGKTDIHTEAGRDLRSTLFDVEQQIIAETDALAAEGIIKDEASVKNQRIIDKLNELKKKYPELAPIIDGHIAKLNEVQSQIKTTAVVDTAQAQKNLDALIAKGKEVQRVLGISGPYSNEQYAKIGENPALLTGKAVGGPVSMGVTYAVNELGREVFVAPTDGSILTANQTQTLLNGGGGNATSSVVIGDIHFHGVTDGDSLRGAIPELVDSLRAAVGSRSGS